MTGRMDSQDVHRLADAIERLTKMRRETDADVGVYTRPAIKVGDDGIQFDLAWDSETAKYYIEECAS